MKPVRLPAGVLCAILPALLPFVISCSRPANIDVQVVDAVSKAPIAGAVVTASGQVLRAGEKGIVSVNRQVPHLAVRAVGYSRTELANTGTNAGNVVVQLSRITPKALYLSFYGVGDAHLRETALRLIDETELNALVIDVKDDRGHITFRSASALAADIGAQKIVTVEDMAGLIAALHARGIYTIARLVAFKDNLLARRHPQWAVHRHDGSLWLDRDGMAWSDPFRREVRDYNIAIAAEAARYGFDEIQFDYIRFPDDEAAVLSQDSNEKSRIAALTTFLAEAAKTLEPYNVFIAADMFGYTLWNQDDTGIGQRLEDLAPQLDYLSPMLYPSSFQFGIPGYRDPVTHISETVLLSLRNAQKRTNLPALRFRPWLQAFGDYAYDRRGFGASEIADQTGAAEEFGSNGWMLWNPRNVYTAGGLKKAERK